MNALYAVSLILFSILSWGFVDSNAMLPGIGSLHTIIFFKTLYPTVWYTATIVVLFSWYIWILHRITSGFLTSKHVWHLIIGTMVILIWSYPALSNDIFNYIATAKVTFLYRENPYIIMPIDIPNDPSFAYLHAANKVALYGPVWIALSAIPYFLGMGDLLATIFTFKVFVAMWYLVLCFLIWIESGKKPWSLAFFGLNPLVTVSTLVDGHNDVVMMALALASLMAIKRHRLAIGTLFLIASIFIKGATVFLLPVLFFKKGTWYWASVAMYAIFLLSPIREEIYAWYFIWALTFLALIDRPTILLAASYGLSFGLCLRIVPFFYTRSWSGMTPLVKKIVTFIPPVITTLIYGKTFRR